LKENIVSALKNFDRDVKEGKFPVEYHAFGGGEEV
jgi:ketopantoate hydroxymethyltransferase